MSLCDPTADLRTCATVDCSEPEYYRGKQDEVPWEALQQSVFGHGSENAQHMRSVKDMQGLDMVLEGHGVSRPSSEDVERDRLSRELKKQAELERMRNEQKAAAEAAMLEKLRAAGATEATLRQVGAAIQRRAEAEATLSARQLPVKTSDENAAIGGQGVLPNRAALPSKKQDQKIVDVRGQELDAQGLGSKKQVEEESMHANLSRRIDTHRGDTSFRAEQTHSQSFHSMEAKAGLGCTLERMSNGVHVVTSVKKGGACERGGVRPGMMILEIDGASIRNMSMKEVRQLALGTVGTQVTVVIQVSKNAPPEVGLLTRYAAGPDVAYDDRTLATSRGPLQSDHSDRSTGSWLSRMFRGRGDVTRDTWNGQNNNQLHSESASFAEQKLIGPLHSRDKQKNVTTENLDSSVGSMRSHQRSTNGRKIEYDKTGQPWFFDSQKMAWVQLQRRSHQEGFESQKPSSPTNRVTTPRFMDDVNDEDYTDRTDASEFGNGPLTDRSFPSPDPHVPTQVPAFADVGQSSHAEESVGNLDHVVNQILESRSARLSARGKPSPRQMPNTPRVSFEHDTVQYVDHRPPQRESSILRSFDLMCSSLPFSEEQNNDHTANTGTYISPFSNSAVIEDTRRSDNLADDRKHLWQHLDALESAVKALEAPSMKYATTPYETVDEPTSASRTTPSQTSQSLFDWSTDDPIAATITFNGLALVHSGQENPFLVFLQDGKELARSTVGDNRVSPTWSPIALLFQDKWNAVTVQCWNGHIDESTHLIGQNEVPVQDLLKLNKEIHIMHAGQHTGKVVIKAVRPGSHVVDEQKQQPNKAAALLAASCRDVDTRPVVEKQPLASTMNSKAQVSPTKGGGEKMPTTWRLKVGLKSANHLPKMDTFGSCDPYVKLKLGAQEYKSKTIKGTYTPVWNEEFEFEVDQSSAEDLVLQVFDWDKLSKDDFVGEVKIRVPTCAGSSGVRELDLCHADSNKLCVGHDKMTSTIKLSLDASEATSSLLKVPYGQIEVKNSSKSADLSLPSVQSPSSGVLSDTRSMPKTPEDDVNGPVVKKNLLPGWNEYWSRSKNRPYYVNKATGETTWKPPQSESSNCESIAE